MGNRLSVFMAISLLLFGMMAGCFDLEDLPSNDEEDIDIVVPETTKQIDQDSLVSVSEDGSTMIFRGSHPGIAAIEKGDVISVGIGEKSPHGLLRKVNRIQRDGEITTMITEQATVEDAVEEGRIEYEQNVTEPVKMIDAVPGVILADEPTRSGSDGILFSNVNIFEGEDGGQITLNGFLDLDFDLIFVLALEDFRITECSFGARTNFDGKFDIASGSDFDFNVELEIARFEFAPVIIPMGTIEVIIVPVLSLVIGSRGTVTSGLSIESEQNSLLDVTVSHPDWSPDKDFTSNFGYNTPVIGSGSYVIFYAGPELSLLLWGVAGPYVNAHGYMEGESDSSGTWWLYGGLYLGMGFKIEVLGTTIEEWEDERMIDFSRLIATSMDDLAGNWIVERLDHAAQLCRPLMKESFRGGTILVYTSIDPETGYFPIRMALLDDGIWTFEELVFSNSYDIMDIAINDDGHVFLAYYKGGARQHIAVVEWDGSSVKNHEFFDPDMAGSHVTDLKIHTDGSGRISLYYFMMEDHGGGGFFKFYPSMFKKAVLDDGSFIDIMLADDEDRSFTGMDLVKSSDGVVHLTYMKVDIELYYLELIHSRIEGGRWANKTVFKEDIYLNNPGSTSLDLDRSDNPSVMFDDNNGSVKFYRFKNGKWIGDESPDMDHPVLGIFSLYHLGGANPVSSHIESSGSRDHFMYFSKLGSEGWDRVPVFEWSGWRFPGGTDISENGERVYIAFNDGSFLRVASKEI